MSIYDYSTCLFCKEEYETQRALSLHIGKLPVCTEFYLHFYHSNKLNLVTMPNCGFLTTINESSN